ncbi:MAG: MMPL family transporter [Spirochaetales bacterium]|nr:MMPL family transporter [Spirochaetales bacterium]
MKRKTLADLALWEAKNRKKTAVLGITMTAIMIILTALFLRVEFTFSSIMPANGEKVQDLNRIIDEFPQASTIIAVIEGEEEQIVKAAKEMKIALENEEFEQIVSSVDISLEKDFLLKNGILLEPIEELFSDEILKSLTSGEIETAAFEEILSTLGDTEFSENDFFYLNKQKDAGLVFIHPTFTANDIMVLKPYVLKIDKVVLDIAEANGVVAGITGMNVVAKDEAVTSEQGLVVSTLIAFILIILLLAINFRKKSFPVIAAIPLIVGIIWTLGLTAIFVNRLNLMTAMYMIALMGIGIDFSIHFITAWIQEMEKDDNFYDAIYNGTKRSSAGIITGGVTSAAAFFALTISSSPLVKELGVVAGLGILCELLAAFIFLPILLPKKLNKGSKKIKPALFEKYVTGPIGIFVAKNTYLTIFFMLAVGVALSSFAGKISIQTNIMEMEAKGLKSIELQDRMVEKFGQSPDGLFIISDSVENTQEIVSKLKGIDEIGSIDSIATFLPKKSTQEKRLAIGSQIKPYLMNFGIPFEVPSSLLEKENIPDSIIQQYFSEDGKYNLITITPSQNCWEKENRNKLTAAIDPITDKATGLILIGDQLSAIAGRDGIIASFAALFVIFLILFFNFRNLWTAILTMLPLLLSIGTLFGIMGLTDLKFDFVNIISIPLVIGIGIDDAVHLSHRFISQNEKIEDTVRFIGRAILLTTLTTAIGFASFIPSVMRALSSTGIVLTLAVSLTFIFSIFFHSAVLKVARDKLKINLSPWFMK